MISLHYEVDSGRLIDGQYDESDYSAEALRLTTLLLADNPEYYSIWNYRRQILDSVFNTAILGEPEEHLVDLPAAFSCPAVKCSLTPIQLEVSLLLKEDLQFLLPLQHASPKTYWMWNHRLWLLNCASKYLPIRYAIHFWQDELDLATKMLGRDDRNFHGWGYRRQVTSTLEELCWKLSLAVPKAENDNMHDNGDTIVHEREHNIETRSQLAMAKAEIDYSNTMVRTNLSNYSAWHHRLQQMRKILDIQQANDNERQDMFDAEVKLVTEALWVSTTIADQSLWFYHQHLMSTLDPTTKIHFTILKNVDMHQRRSYIEQQINAVQEVKEDNEDLKWVYQSLIDLSQILLNLNGRVVKADVELWMSRLEELDPLRKGRWSDLRHYLLPRCS